MRRFAAFATIAISMLSFSTASAETLIKNDSATEMLNGTFASGALISGEMYEAVFDIPRAYLEETTGAPLEMLGVQALFVDGETGQSCGRFSIEVWEEPVGAPTPSAETSCDLSILGGGAGRPAYKDPGALIFSMSSIMVNNSPIGFQVEGQNRMGSSLMTEMRFAAINSNPNINVTIPPVYLNTTRIRVGVKALDLGCVSPQASFPVLVSDFDGVNTPNTNFIYGALAAFGVTLCSTQHYVWETFAPGLVSSTPGDWVLRLITNHGTVTLPMDMGTDMSGGTDMGSTADMSSDMSEDSGNGEADMAISDMAISDMAISSDMSVELGALSVTSISPSSASNESSTDVVIMGSGFEVGAEVIFGATTIGVTETRAGTIKAVVPEGLDPGVYDVIVTNPDDETAVLADGFEVFTPITDSGGGVDEGCGCDTSRAATTSMGGLLVAFFLLFFAFVRTRESHDPTQLNKRD